MLKVGLVGVGGISGVHIPAWNNIDGVELVALCDIRPEQLKPHADKHCYTDFDEMLAKEDLDILDICLPTDLHADYAVKAMEKKIHVLCEKPIALHAQDVQRVYGTAEKMGVKFMIAHVLRFWPEYEQLKEIIDTQKYGKLLSGKMTRVSQMPGWSFEGWMQDEKRSGFVPFDLHIHDLDFLVYALGKPNSVRSTRIKREDQDSFAVIYDYDGAFINCESAWYAAAYPFEAGFRFQFEDAVVSYTDGKLTVYGREGVLGDESNTADSTASGVINLPTTNAYENEIRYFTDCVMQDKQPDKVKAEELQTVVEILNTL